MVVVAECREEWDEYAGVCRCEVCELERIDRWEELERLGVKLPCPRTPNSVLSGLFYPPGPIRVLLDGLIAEAEATRSEVAYGDHLVLGAVEQVGAMLGVSGRRLQEYRLHVSVLDEIQVDRVLTPLLMVREQVFSREVIELAADGLERLEHVRKVVGVRAPAREVCAWMLRVERTCEGLE
jgi:hypothetical protein